MSVCFVALGIQRAMRMRHITCRLCPVWFYNIVPRYLIKGAIFGKKSEQRNCVLMFSTIFVGNISHY